MTPASAALRRRRLHPGRSRLPTTPRPGGLAVLPVPGLPEFRPGDDLAARSPPPRPGWPTATSWSSRRKIVLQGRGPARRRARPTRRSATRCAASSSTPRPSGWSPGAGRTLIVADKLGIVQAAAGVDGSNVAARRARPAPGRPRRQRRPAARRAARAARRRRRRRRHRHDGPLLADRADRRRDRRRRASPVLHRYGGMVDVAGQRAAASPRSRWPTRSPGAADLVKGKLGGVPVAVVRGLRPTDDGSAARDLVRPLDDDLFRLGTEEALAQGRREAVLLRRSRSARSPTTPVDLAALRRAVGVALTAPAPHHSTPFRFVVVRERRTALLDAMADAVAGRPRGRRAARRRGRAPDAPRRPAAPRPRARARRSAPATGMHDYPDDARRAARAHDVHRGRGRGGAVAAGRARRRRARVVLGRLDDLRRRTSCARVLDLPPDWQPLGAIAVGVPAEPLAAACAAGRDGLLEW